MGGPSSNGRTPVFGTGGGGSNPPGPIRSRPEGGALIASPVLAPAPLALAATLAVSSVAAAVPPREDRNPPPDPSPQEALAQPDSSAIHDRARDAQRRFERVRVQHLPRSIEPGSSPCDEVIGRMCYWHGDNHHEPDPEAVETTVAREELLDTLAHAARQLPGDGWIAGQRVFYLVEAGRAHEALEVARGCAAPEPDLCELLRGLALHRLERFEDAERSYRLALEAMDSRDAEEWLSLALLLERTDESGLDRLGPEAREAATRRLWALADPYYLVRGNDRWTEHMSRHAVSRIQRRARNPHGLPWTSGLDELAIRYGQETSWTRYVPASGSSMTPRVTGRHPPHSERYMPPDGVLTGVASLPPGMVWGDPVERPRSAYAPSYAPELGTMYTVLARFRRGDSLLVVAPFRFEPRDTSGAVPGPGSREAGSGHRRDVQAGLFLVPWAETTGEVRPPTQRMLSDRGTLSLVVPLGSYVYSVEALDRRAGHGARFRGDLALGPHPDDIPDLSDFLIIEAPERMPESVDDVLDHALPSLALGGLQELAVAWEAYGLGTGESRIAYSLGVEPLDRSFFRRLGEFLRLVGRGDPLTLEWIEPSPGRPGAHFRSVDLDFRNLEPGIYELRLELTVDDWAPVIRRRRVQIVG